MDRADSHDHGPSIIRWVTVCGQMHLTPPLGVIPSEFLGETYPAKTRGIALMYGEHCMIVFDGSKRVTGRRTDGQTDGRTDGQAIAYSEGVALVHLGM